MARRLRLLSTSRYKSTPLFQDGRTLSFFGSWNPPTIPLDEQDDQSHQTRASDVGRLDNLANEFYGNPALWWVIAQANNITSPLHADSYPDVLRIPSPARVEAIVNEATFQERVDA